VWELKLCIYPLRPRIKTYIPGTYTWYITYIYIYTYIYAWYVVPLLYSSRLTRKGEPNESVTLYTARIFQEVLKKFRMIRPCSVT